jgi:nucleoside-diphosphate-sugar epimerase
MISTVLITGGNGFLGRNLNQFFLNKEFDVINLGKSNSNEIKCDISTTVPKVQTVDFVIHAAGKAHVIPRTDEEAKDFFKVNYLGTVNLCKGLAINSELPKQFIFISTVAVYGIDEGENIDESYPLKGNTPYAKSKIEAENYLLNWARDNKVVLTILRLPLITGPNPPGNLGAMINGIKSGKYASIGKANARKSMIWVDDIPEFILKVKNTGGIYNLTDNYHPTFDELELLLAKKLNKPKPLKIPLIIAKCLALIGDLIGEKFLLNSDKLKKITGTLTFSSKKAMNVCEWKPTQVLKKL